jgi:hypothetical protein
LDIIETAKSWSGDLQKATETAQKMGDIDKLVAIAMKQALSDGTTQAIEIAQKIPDQGAVDFSSEITISLNFTTEHTENAEAPEKPNNGWNSLKTLCTQRSPR